MEKTHLSATSSIATSLERSLYLTTSTFIFGTDIDVVIALTRSDALEKSGLTVDSERLSNV
jgi:Fe2+ transport system protein B